ncbi:hypothetical protein R1flu_001551 [Riccia fluitans]|uniref:Exostosin GT47 domain-containing protein n=1 Tax=Riccia fluitans TaxID=41844 RepID=A0ABD1Y3Y0_9MARC
MPLPGIMRVMMYQRMALIPPLCLVIILYLWISTTLSNFDISHQFFSQDVQCISCTEETAFSYSTGDFFSFPNFPTASYIKEFFLRNNPWRVDDSSLESLSLNSNNAGESQAVVADQEDREAEDNRHIQSDHERHDGNRSGNTVMTWNTTAPTMQIEPGDPPIMDWNSTAPIMQSEPAEPPVMTWNSTESTIQIELADAPITTWNSTAPAMQTESAEPPVMAWNYTASTTQIEPAESPVMNWNSTASTMRMEPAEPPVTTWNSTIQADPAEPPAMTWDSTGPTMQIEQAEPSMAEPMFKYENMSAEDVFRARIAENVMHSIRESALPHSNDQLDQPFVIQAKDKPLYVRDGTPQGAIAPELPSCDGRYIYLYNLPSKFNADLVAQCDALDRWPNLCDYLQNDGMGLVLDYTDERKEPVLIPVGSWHMTYQYSLEPILHARMKNYDCLTEDESKASLFFIPYYGALDVNRWEFADNATNEDRDALPLELVHWLEGRESWKRNNGVDHVLVLGETSWDFRRSTENGGWGSRLLQLPQMVAPTKLLIERNNWDTNDIGIPYPTAFHPKSDVDIWTWQYHCEKSERRYLVSFARLPRLSMLGNVQGHLIQQCLDNPQDCFYLRCDEELCLRPESTMDLFLHSHFCMQPPGDSPSSRSVFDSLIGGCIPVLFDPYTAYYQYPWHLPEDSKSFSVYIPSEHVMSGRANIIEILKTISAEERTVLRARIIHDILPGLVYSEPGAKHPSFRDAFDISIEGLVQRVANIRAKKAAGLGTQQQGDPLTR